MKLINDKLYLVTRKDLCAGYQSVQPAHALAQFSQEHPQTFYEWYKKSQNLVVLAATNEKALEKLIEACEKEHLYHSVFREPDIGNAITALCIEPGDTAAKLLSNIPLALKE